MGALLEQIQQLHRSPGVVGGRRRRRKPSRHGGPMSTPQQTPGMGLGGLTPNAPDEPDPVPGQGGFARPGAEMTPEREAEFDRDMGVGLSARLRRRRRR